ncbi:MAG TPA: hypothetical protein VNK41_06435, partial [Vicinamibacterales bacterium]|nr:hypothetical protein [Vicinamibacterales bacterium]
MSAAQVTLIDQIPSTAEFGFAGLSNSDCIIGDAQISVARAEDFTVGEPVTIDTIVFWGMYVQETDPSDPETFAIRIHEDAGGLPGPSWPSAIRPSASRLPARGGRSGAVVVRVHSDLLHPSHSRPASTGWRLSRPTRRRMRASGGRRAFGTKSAARTAPRASGFRDGLERAGGCPDLGLAIRIMG